MWTTVHEECNPSGTSVVEAEEGRVRRKSNQEEARQRRKSRQEERRERRKSRMEEVIAEGGCAVGKPLMVSCSVRVRGSC